MTSPQLASMQESFPVLAVYGGLLPDAVTRFLQGLGELEAAPHPSAIRQAQLETPMMKQFSAAKKEAPDALLFFRMGDFFELFGLDAVIASLECRLTLTSRDKSSEQPVPMAGVPVVSYRSAVKKCVEAGFKVAICDQVEDPKDTKTIVRREIVRVVTPALSGDIFEDEESSPSGSFLAAVATEGERWGLAALDAATGEAVVAEGVGEPALEHELLSLMPKEVLIWGRQAAAQKKMILRLFQRSSKRSCPAVLERILITPHGAADLKRRLELIYPQHGDLGSTRHQEGELGTNSAEVVESCFKGPECVAVLHDYLQETQKTSEFHWKTMRRSSWSEHLVIDASSREHLQLFPVDDASQSGAVFPFLNHCVTPMGRRLLWQRLAMPLRRAEDVAEALQLTTAFFERDELLGSIRAALAQVADCDRISGRAVQLQMAPRDLIALRRSLHAALEVRELVDSRVNVERREDDSSPEAPSCSLDALQRILSKRELFRESELLQTLDRALGEDAQAQLGKGCFFQAGYDGELDRLHQVASHSGAALQELQEAERKKTGIANLKVGFNRVFGYYIEVSKGRTTQVPSRFLRKQTLTNAERYITDELKELEVEILSAEDKRNELEAELFSKLVSEVSTWTGPLSQLNDALALLDLHLALARVAFSQGWCLPEIDSGALCRYRGLVHPVVQSEMLRHGQRFVPNDLEVGKSEESEPVLLITGPNMAGKSTIMRQVALAQVLSQMGSYVPAEQAQVGLCDKLFTRIGSGDDLMGARSTFMVEMSETAQILRQATSQSLILMDEIGRGTSTWDGLALAWAILEELNGALGARTLFSTHYHELSVLAEKLDSTCAMQIEVHENPQAELPEERILFTHRIVRGAARESYGIHVAQMAGLPESVIHRAQEQLSRLTNDVVSRNIAVGGVPPAAAERKPAVQEMEETAPSFEGADELLDLDLSRLTPLKLMMIVAEWQERHHHNPRGGRKKGSHRAVRERRRNSPTSSDNLLF